MHPLLTGRGTIALYVAAWLVIAALIAALLIIPGTFGWSAAAMLVLPMSIVYAFMCLSSYYLCRAFPLLSTNVLKVFIVLLVAAVATSAVWVLAGSAWAMALGSLFNDAQFWERYRLQYPLLFGIGVVLSLLVAAVHYVIIAFEQARAAERRAYELRLLAQGAELKLLRAQIDPHFLFNSLNSVAALISSDPDGARTMSVRLAGFLRESLRLGAQEFIAVREELALARDFLRIEQVRFGKRLQVEESVTPDAETVIIPSLLLQPLVENAVTHGIAHLVDGGTIRIAARRTAARLIVEVWNPCDADRPRSKGPGIGLQNVRYRLSTLYGSDGSLEVEETNRYFRVIVSLPSTAER